MLGSQKHPGGARLALDQAGEQKAGATDWRAIEAWLRLAHEEEQQRELVIP
jgi:hypothetical protein